MMKQRLGGLILAWLVASSACLPAKLPVKESPSVV